MKWNTKKRIKRMRKAISNNKKIMLLNEDISIDTMFDVETLITTTGKSYCVCNDKDIEVLDITNEDYLAALISHEFNMSILESISYVKYLVGIEDWKVYIPVIWDGSVKGISNKDMLILIHTHFDIVKTSNGMGSLEYNFLKDLGRVYAKNKKG